MRMLWQTAWQFLESSYPMTWQFHSEMDTPEQRALLATPEPHTMFRAIQLPMSR